MSEMIERAAEAAFMADWPKDNWSRFGNEDYVKNRYRRIARAAIEAMREPTEAMKVAFYKDVDDWFDHQIHDDHHLYKCMIDAALKEAA